VKEFWKSVKIWQRYHHVCTVVILTVGIHMHSDPGAEFTPPNLTRRNKTVLSRRVGRCKLGIRGALLKSRLGIFWRFATKAVFTTSRIVLTWDERGSTSHNSTQRIAVRGPLCNGELVIDMPVCRNDMTQRIENCISPPPWIVNVIVSAYRMHSMKCGLLLQTSWRERGLSLCLAHQWAWQNGWTNGDVWGRFAWAQGTRWSQVANTMEWSVRRQRGELSLQLLWNLVHISVQYNTENNVKFSRVTARFLSTFAGLCELIGWVRCCNPTDHSPWINPTHVHIDRQNTHFQTSSSATDLDPVDVLPSAPLLRYQLNSTENYVRRRL